MAMQPATSNDDRGQSVGAFPQRRLLPKTGQQTISWTIQDPDSTSFTSMILYSPDNGADWSQLGQVGSDTSLTLDFGTVPGSNRATALIQVLVSDGINTGSATTAPFTVPRKNPTVVLINSPQEGFSQAAIDPILLVGSAYDPDDGVLTGASLQWSSNLQGALGTGSPLSTTLQPGAHKITLTATDSDGNAISTYVDVVIGGGRPVLSITSNQLPSNCTSATITATPGVNGAALSLVQYSVDGGNTYTTVPLSQLPFSFVVPGSGNINLITRAYDISSQSSARSTIFTIPSACVNARQPQMFAGSGQNTPVGNPFISPLVVLVQDSGGNPVPGVTVNFTLAAGGAGATLSATSATTGPDGKASVTATANSNAGNYTVVAGVTGFSTTVLFTLSNSDFGVSSSTPALIIPHGQSASITLTLTSINNFTQPISFSCSGLPTGATCGFSPKTVTPQGAAVTTTLTVSVAPAVSYQRKGNRPWGRMRLVFVFCLLGIGLRKGRKLTTVFLLVAVITLGALLLSCGGGFAPVSGVANQTSANSATSTVTVTASSGQLQHRTSFVLTMQ